MSRIALLHPTTLVAKELIERLDGHPDLAPSLRLLSLDDDEVGQLTEASGEAALVLRAEPQEFAAADVIVVCGDPAPYRELLARRGDGATVILVAPEPAAEGGQPEGRPVVAGLNLDGAEAGAVLVSPHAGSILLSLLLAPLVRGPLAGDDAPEGPGPGVERATATVIQPVSVFDRPGLDDLFTQAGRMVSMQNQEPSALFGDRQLAFNLYPAPRPPRHLPAEVRAVLGDAAPPLAAHVLQGAVFHGFSTLLHVVLGEGREAEAVRDRLGAHPLVELYEPSVGAREQLGPIDVPSSDKVLVGAVQADPETDRGFWIWAVMDNLTRGGALNVLGMLERLG